MAHQASAKSAPKKDIFIWLFIISYLLICCVAMIVGNIYQYDHVKTQAQKTELEIAGSGTLILKNPTTKLVNKYLTGGWKVQALTTDFWEGSTYILEKPEPRKDTDK